MLDSIYHTTLKLHFGVKMSSRTGGHLFCNIINYNGRHYPMLPNLSSSGQLYPVSFGDMKIWQRMWKLCLRNKFLEKVSHTF